MSLDPQKITLNGNSYEFAAAEVVSVDYEARDPDKLYTILVKLLNAGVGKSPSDLVQARALNSNIKHIPIIGEIVFVCKAPTPYHSGAGYGREFYYTAPISIQSSVHHNGLPGANKISVDGKSRETKMQEARVGLTPKLSDNTLIKDQIDPGFPERIDVSPIQPFPGDIIIEGRWGNSIRLGSTVDTRRRYPQQPSWGIGTGATGNPIIIISNGTNPKNKKYNEFHLESPDDDDASIWLTSGQSIKFTPASKYEPSIRDKEIDLFRKNVFGGNQTIIASDRIVLNANKQEIVGYSKEGIGFATEKCLALNAKNIVELEGGKISLGFNATHPILLGDRMIEVLARFFDLVIKMNEAITLMTVGTGTGPSSTPLNSGEFISIINGISSLLNSLPDTASRFAFVNEKSGGATSNERDEFAELKNNGFKVKLPEIQGGDKSGKVSFDTLRD